MKKKFKIVDSFLFSEVYEKELLLLKFQLEDVCIDEWILLENAYSFQGEFTGLHAQNLIDSDARFKPYLHKLTILSKEEPMKVLPKHQFLDEFSFKAEHWQRNIANDYFLEKYSNEDWIMVSDVDEMIDFSNMQRREELLQRMNEAKDGLLLVPTRRYWYDFDNAYLQLIGNAMCNKKYLIENNKMLHHVRFENRKVLDKPWKNIIQFEYSSCYSKEYMLRKFYTSTHTGFGADDLLLSLRCNQRPVRISENEKPENSNKFFFETIVLTEKNSPDQVRTNLAFFKTNAIDPDYKQNRRTTYPELFAISYYLKFFFNKKTKRLKKKLANLKTKLC